MINFKAQPFLSASYQSTNNVSARCNQLVTSKPVFVAYIMFKKQRVRIVQYFYELNGSFTTILTKYHSKKNSEQLLVKS